MGPKIGYNRTTLSSQFGWLFHQGKPLREKLLRLKLKIPKKIALGRLK